LLSINNTEGDAIKTIQLRENPHGIKFGKLKDDNGLPGTVDNTVRFETLTSQGFSRKTFVLPNNLNISLISYLF